MWTGNLTWRNICSAIAVVGLLVWSGGGGVEASARYDWCYNACGPEASCESECENNGGGTTTCGEYQTGYPNYCDADNCDIQCTSNSNPGADCIWEGQPTDCYTYGVYGVCGDNVCSGITLGETCTNCEDDCGVCPPPIVCGDDLCESGETYRTCPDDCDDPGLPGYCGDGICSEGDGEDEDTCYDDCAMPNERCEDDFDCPAGYTCAAGGEPFGGQCVRTDLIWTFNYCDPFNNNSCGYLGAGFVCREIPGYHIPYCIYWWDLE